LNGSTIGEDCAGATSDDEEEKEDGKEEDSGDVERSLLMDGGEHRK